jgi:protein-tyrosine kinase
MSFVERAIKKMQLATPPTAGVQRRDEAPVAPAVPTPVADQPVRVAPAKPDIHIDRYALRGAGLYPPEAQVRLLNGQYRQIKRPLIAAALGRGAEVITNGRFIMLASALPGEGKTFTCVNLALSMAMDKDISVLLVDADVAKPHISKVLGVEDRRGLLDCLEDESCDPESLVLTTDVPGLQVLPAGGRSETAPELLASVRMEKVAAQLLAASPDRVLLFDSPPLLLTNESRALAQVAGQIIIVVRAGITLQSDVKEAISLIGESKPIGLILNQSVEERSRQYYYGYGIERSGVGDAGSSASTAPKE